MIAAALALLAVGVADLVRQFVAGRWRWAAFAIAALALFLVSAAVDAALWGFVAIAVAAIWVLVVRSDGRGRGGLWPVSLLGVAAASAVVVTGPRTSTLAFAELWSVPGPAQSVPVDVLVLVAGAVAFLLESANIVVRTALRAEHSAGDDAPTTLKGGRLIGPLERVLVFALTLAGAYTLIAAVLAAKGIVRFPEISKDSADGNRAEYFLIGSLVSWVIAFAAALLVWWGAH